MRHSSKYVLKDKNNQNILLRFHIQKNNREEYCAIIIGQFTPVEKEKFYNKYNIGTTFCKATENEICVAIKQKAEKMFARKVVIEKTE